MLKKFSNDTFMCQDFQFEMLELLRDNHPGVYSDILKEVDAVKASHPSLERDVEVSIFGMFEQNKCRKILKRIEDFHKFESFEVQPYTTSCPTAQNNEWITDSIVVYAN